MNKKDYRKYLAAIADSHREVMLTNELLGALELDVLTDKQQRALVRILLACGGPRIEVFGTKTRGYILVSDNGAIEAREISQDAWGTVLAFLDITEGR